MYTPALTHLRLPVSQLRAPCVLSALALGRNRKPVHSRASGHSACGWLECAVLHKGELIGTPGSLHVTRERT